MNGKTTVLCLYWILTLFSDCVPSVVSSFLNHKSHPFSSTHIHFLKKKSFNKKIFFSSLDLITILFYSWSLFLNLFNSFLLVLEEKPTSLMWLSNLPNIQALTASPELPHQHSPCLQHTTKSDKTVLISQVSMLSFSVLSTSVHIAVCISTWFLLIPK